VEPVDKELLKGLAILVGVVVLVCVLFVAGSGSGPQKAKCIASALKFGMAYANIDKACQLTPRSY
jgi:hypothetical protein